MVNREINPNDLSNDIGTMQFALSDGRIIGNLTWHKGYLEFIGDANTSAQIFFEFLRPYIDSYISSAIEKGKEKQNDITQGTSD